MSKCKLCFDSGWVKDSPKKDGMRDAILWSRCPHILAQEGSGQYTSRIFDSQIQNERNENSRK